MDTSPIASLHALTAAAQTLARTPTPGPDIAHTEDAARPTVPEGPSDHTLPAEQLTPATLVGLQVESAWTWPLPTPHTPTTVAPHDNTEPRAQASPHDPPTPHTQDPQTAIHACAGLAAFGDAIALIDRSAHLLAWASPAWRRLQPTLREGTSLSALEHALPGLADARLAHSNTATGPRRLGEAQQWEAHIAVLDDQHRLIRLADRREQGRALQRQLDDRERLLFTSRVISVGEMATTLAHEINQPIGAAANLLRGLRSRLTQRTTGRLAEAEAHALDRAIDQVMFAARVIARIREFTHSHQPRHAPLDLAKLLRASATLLDWDVQRSSARLSLQLPEAPVPVRGDEVMLQQVVVNLMRNALDALRADPPAHPHVDVRLRVHAGEAEVQVCDNGCGMSDEAQARLFVPFASSKPSGMGIGLSICRSFAELHQGRLWFSRNADRGVTFHLNLPLITEAKP